MNKPHDRHFTNLDAAEVPLYERAISESGKDLSIRPGAFDCHGRMWDGSRYSLWGPMRTGGLSEFWKFVDAQ